MTLSNDDSLMEAAPVNPEAWSRIRPAGKSIWPLIVEAGRLLDESLIVDNRRRKYETGVMRGWLGEMDRFVINRSTEAEIAAMFATTATAMTHGTGFVSADGRQITTPSQFYKGPSKAQWKRESFGRRAR